jgi:hypothetical protein
MSICPAAMKLLKEPLYIRPLTRSAQIHLAPLRFIGFKVEGSSDFGPMGVLNKRIMGKPIYVEICMARNIFGFVNIAAMSSPWSPPKRVA